MDTHEPLETRGWTKCQGGVIYNMRAGYKYIDYFHSKN